MTDRKPPKLKVLQIVRIPAGGIRKHIVSIIEGMESGNFECYLATDVNFADNTYKISPPLSDDKIYSISIPNSPGPKDLLMLWKLYCHYKSFKLDIIHGHGAKGGLYARLLGRMLGAKVFYTAHGGSLHAMHGSLKNALYQIIEKTLYYFTDKLVFESEYSRDTYFTKVRDAGVKAVLNYNGTHVPEVLPASKNFSGEITIGAFGILRPIKGHDLLIKAAKLLLDNGYNIRVLISGSGEEENNLRKLATSLKIEDKLTIQTDTSDVEATMKECHLIAHPSHFESFGYVAIEAMALGIPVLSSDRGGLKEIVKDNETGYVFSLTPESISEKVQQAVDDTEKRNRIIEKAYTKVSTKFNEQSMVSNILEEYRNNV
ncbi:MAG: glycosyltransferase, partial [Bacteriovoracaceae bacterium]|nr:glycosyltransferase [Bacteriovoracaceae bacterium]